MPFELRFFGCTGSLASQWIIDSKRQNDNGTNGMILKRENSRTGTNPFFLTSSLQRSKNVQFYRKKSSKNTIKEPFTIENNNIQPHATKAVKLRRLYKQITLFALASIAAVQVFADTRTSTMSFPAQPHQFETVTETDSNHWSESLTTTTTGNFTIDNTQKNGNSLALSSNWNRTGASIETVDDLLAAPYRKADTLQLTGKYDVPLSNAWSGYADGGFSIATGSSATISDGYSLIASAGASYAVNPRLKFSIGLLTNNNFFNSMQAMPIIGLDWDITDRLKLRTLNGAFLSYDLGKSTEIDISLQYLDQAFTVENLQGTAFMKMDQPVVLEESSIVGTLGVRHNWKDVFSIRAYAEIAGNREIQSPAPSEGIDVVEIRETDDRRISFGVEGGIRF